MQIRRDHGCVLDWWDICLATERLDGALTTTDQVTVTVTGQSLPLRIESAQFTGGAGAGLHIRFNANAGQSYGVEYRNSLSSGSWTTLTNIPPQATSQSIEVIDGGVAGAATRFYRIRTP